MFFIMNIVEIYNYQCMSEFYVYIEVDSADFLGRAHAPKIDTEEGGLFFSFILWVNMEFSSFFAIQLLCNVYNSFMCVFVSSC